MFAKCRRNWTLGGADRGRRGLLVSRNWSVATRAQSEV